MLTELGLRLLLVGSFTFKLMIAKSGACVKTNTRFFFDFLRCKRIHRNLIVYYFIGQKVKEYLNVIDKLVIYISNLSKSVYTVISFNSDGIKILLLLLDNCSQFY
jgi:hypothetical protein